MVYVTRRAVKKYTTVTPETTVPVGTKETLSLGGNKTTDVEVKRDGLRQMITTDYGTSFSVSLPDDRRARPDFVVGTSLRGEGTVIYTQHSGTEQE